MERRRNTAPRGYTVKELGALAGVSVRTLHHYHTIGLLRPDHVGTNGYRYYGREELLRLQEILVLRELDLSLTLIAQVLDADDRDRVARLAAHRDRLVSEAARRRRLIDTLDQTIEHLKGRRAMTDEELYDGLSPERQANYEAWLTERYGDDMPMRIDAARRKMIVNPNGKVGLGPEAVAELARIESALVVAFETGVDPRAPDLAPILEDHRAWVANRWGWPCDADAYTGLAELYLAHPDFVARFEALAPGFSVFLTDAMKSHMIGKQQDFTGAG